MKADLAMLSLTDRATRIAALLAGALLCSCQGNPGGVQGRTGLEATQSSKASFLGRQNTRPAAAARGEVALLSPQSETQQPYFEPQGDKVTLNLVNAPIPVVAKVIFADILKNILHHSDIVTETDHTDAHIMDSVIVETDRVRIRSVQPIPAIKLSIYQAVYNAVFN